MVGLGVESSTAQGRSSDLPRSKGCAGQRATHNSTRDSFCLGFSRFFRGYEYFREGWGNTKVNCNEQQEIQESDFETIDDGTRLEEVAEQKVGRFQKFGRCTSLLLGKCDRPRRASRVPQESCMCLCSPPVRFSQRTLFDRLREHGGNRHDIAQSQCVDHTQALVKK